MTHTDVMLTRHETSGGFYFVCKRRIQRKAIETGGFQLLRQPGQTCPSTMSAFLSGSRGFVWTLGGEGGSPFLRIPPEGFLVGGK